MIADPATGSSPDGLYYSATVKSLTAVGAGPENAEGVQPVLSTQDRRVPPTAGTSRHAPVTTCALRRVAPAQHERTSGSTVTATFEQASGQARASTRLVPERLFRGIAPKVRSLASPRAGSVAKRTRAPKPRGAERLSLTRDTAAAICCGRAPQRRCVCSGKGLGGSSQTT